METGTGTCWACLKILTLNSAVWITEESSIPVCKKCWRQIPTAKRIEIALAFHDRSDQGLGIAETLSEIQDMIRSSFGGYVEKRLRGGAEGMN